MKTLVSIQYLRGLAALAVVVYHVLQWRHGGFETGRAGVDVFFIISGLIMWRITARERPFRHGANKSAAPPSPLCGAGGILTRDAGEGDHEVVEGAQGRVTTGAFLWRRLTRVAPAYWLATLTVGAVALAWPRFLVHVRPTWPHLALSLAFIPHNDPEGLPFPLLAPGWTLNYEAVFYLVFAAGLAVRESRRLWLVTGALAAIAAAGFAYHPAYTLGANPMMLQFAAGVWLGKLAGDKALPGRAWGAGLLLGGLAIFTGFVITGYVNELWRPLIWGVPALMIVAGAVSLEASGAMVNWPPLKSLGDASYSLYLWHVPVVALVAHGFAEGRSWLFLPAAVTAAVFAGLASRALVEKPALALLRRGGSRVGGNLIGAR